MLAATGPKAPAAHHAPNHTAEHRADGRRGELSTWYVNTQQDCVITQIRKHTSNGYHHTTAKLRKDQPLAESLVWLHVTS